MFKKILVATHGTEGAKNAERYSYELAKIFGAELHGLYVIHKGWSSLIGIEWLHSSHARMEFYRYAESQFNLRANEVLESFKKIAADIKVTTSVKVGEPTEIILEEARVHNSDLIVIGCVSSVRSEEYKARISMKNLLKFAPCPVLLANNAPAIIKEGGETKFSNISALIGSNR
jgi:nucleotide-binding universal stress UspA family protein